MTFEQKSSVVAIAIVAFLFGILLMALIVSNGYRKGQIDAINGNIMYELVTQPNGEMKWEMKK